MPRSPSMKHTADSPATTSSRPAFGFASTAMGGHPLLPAGDLWSLHEQIIAANLLEDGQKSGIEETDLEQHEEGHRAVNPVLKRVEDRSREVQAKPDFDERLDRHRLVV